MKITILVLLLSLLSVFSSSVSNADTLPFKNQVYTLNPDLSPSGPFRRKNQSEKYDLSIFNLIVEEAHKIAKKYISYDDPKAYWSFMTAALTVPFHESINIHFLKVKNDGASCLPSSNSGKVLQKIIPKKASSKEQIIKARQASFKFQKIFREHLKAQKRPIVPNCNRISEEEVYTQLLHGGTGDDIGITQINIRAHEMKFVATEKFLSVRKSIRYGLKHLIKGFERLYRRKKACILNPDKSINQAKLIRGAWAGIYNSGNHRSACRFANKKKDPRDINFKRNLNKIINWSKKRTAYKSLKNKDAIIIFNTIVRNFKRPTRKDFKLMKNYVKNKRIKSIITPPELSILGDQIFKINTSWLAVREKGSMRSQRCGVLKEGTNIKVVTYNQSGWSQLEVTSSISKKLNLDLACKSFFVSSKYISEVGSLIVVKNEKKKKVIFTKKPYALTDLNVRNNYTQNGILGKYTGNTLKKGEGILIVKKVFPMKKSKHPWYKITSPYKGWVSGKYIRFK